MTAVKPPGIVSPHNSSTRRSAITGWILLIPALIALLSLVIVPLLMVLRNSFARSDNYGRVQGGFTFDNYISLIDEVYLKTISYSLGAAAITTAFCLLVGYAVGWFIATRPAHHQASWMLILVIPYWTDFLVRTFAWMNLLGAGGPFVSVLNAFGFPIESLIPSEFAVISGLIYAFLPTAIFPIYASLRSVDPTIIEASADLGSSTLQTHLRIVIPLSMPGILTAALLTFVPSLGVFVIPVLLGGGKNPLVTLYTEFRNQPLGAAVSICLLLFLAISAGISFLILKASQRRRSA